MRALNGVEKKKEDMGVLCFLGFTALYYSIAGSVLVYKERRTLQKNKSTHKARAKALDRAISVTNFSNAVISTILSSVSLYYLTAEQRTDIYLRRPSKLSQWTIESVCSYIFVELTFIYADSFRLSEKHWKLAKGAFMPTTFFHIVALFGLSSVLLYNTGYAIALWVVWSELTSVFLGIEDWMEEKLMNYTFPVLYQLVKTCTTVIFVFQRVVMFIGLLWLCAEQFTWQLLFLLQLLILCVGTLTNAWFVLERLFSWNEWFALKD